MIHAHLSSCNGNLYLQAGSSCLAIAARNGHLEVVKYLCSLGNSKIISLKNHDGVSPLDKAKEQGHTAVVEYLRSIGCR
jgi:ankyrin repeat protein